MDLPTLAATLAATLSPDYTTRSNAEAALAASASQPGFAGALLALAREPGAHAGSRQSALVLLKGAVVRRWDAADERFIGPEVTEPEKEREKKNNRATV